MKQPALEAVIIASPTQVHAKQAEQAMRAGKHVLIEIPIADSVADSERLVSVQQQTGVVGMAGHMRRFNPSHHSHVSRFGQYTLDLSRTPPPVDYHLPIELADDLMVHVVGLDDLIRLKSASGLNAHRAPKDLHDAVVWKKSAIAPANGISPAETSVGAEEKSEFATAGLCTSSCVTMYT